MISYMKHMISLYMISCMIIYIIWWCLALSSLTFHALHWLAAADRPPAQRADASDDGSTRWTSGCGAAAGAAPWWCLSLRRRGSGQSGSARTRAAETRKRRSVAAAAAGAAQGGGGANWTLAYDIIGHIIYNFMYDIIGMKYDIIAYDIIVNIIPVISGALHYLGPWP
jgi:hypothetical protein